MTADHVAHTDGNNSHHGRYTLALTPNLKWNFGESDLEKELRQMMVVLKKKGVVNGRNSFGNCFICTIESRTVLFVAKFGQELTELGFSASF